MLQAAAMIQIKSFAPFPLPLMFGCSVKMHVRNTVGRQALMFWALTQVALARLSCSQKPGRAGQSHGAPSATSTLSGRALKMREGPCGSKLQGRWMWMRLCVDDGMDRLATEHEGRADQQLQTDRNPASNPASAVWEPRPKIGFLQECPVDNYEPCVCW